MKTVTIMLVSKTLSRVGITPQAQQRELTAVFCWGPTTRSSSANPNTASVPFYGSTDCFFPEEVKTNLPTATRMKDSLLLPKLS